MNRKMVSPGKGKAKDSTNSAGGPAASMASINSWLRRRMYGSMSPIRLLENPWRVWTRMRPWSGSGRFDMTATGSKSGALRVSWAAGASGNTGSCTFTEANVSWSVKMRSISAISQTTR